MDHVFGMPALDFLRFLNVSAQKENDPTTTRNRGSKWKKWEHIDNNKTDNENLRKWKVCTAFLTLFFHLIYGPLVSDVDDYLPSPDDAYAIIRLGNVMQGTPHTDTGIKNPKDPKAAKVLRESAHVPMALLVTLGEHDR